MEAMRIRVGAVAVILGAKGWAQTTECVSVAAQANNDSFRCSVSADGRCVAFCSYSNNLVSGDSNVAQDVFVRDRLAGTTERVSVATGGTQANGFSYFPSISADGRYVTFDSAATNLVAGDTNACRDVFVRDRQSGTTERVSLSTGGTQADGIGYFPSISADGRYVTFDSDATNFIAGDTNGARDVFVYDRQSGTTERVSVATGGAEGNSGSYAPARISADGRYVAFESVATNLVPGDTNGYDDIFVRDRQSGTTERVSVATSGAQGNLYSWISSISADGRYVAFYSPATNLVPGDTNGFWDVFLRDRLSSTTERVSISFSHGFQGNDSSKVPSISADGRYVAFESDASNLVTNDSNNAKDIFLRDRQNGTNQRVSLSALSGNSFSEEPSISAGGRFVAFKSNASNLVPGDTNNSQDIFVRDYLYWTTERVSVGVGGTQGNSGSSTASISADGRCVAFASDASNLVPGDTSPTDVFVRDRQSGTTERVSVATGGAQANNVCMAPSISADGRYVVFLSYATNLVAGDTNGYWDVFVRDRQSGTTERVSVATGGAEGNADSYSPASISADGRYVAFSSDATNLVAGDTKGAADVFLRDRQSGTTERVSVATGGAQANFGGSAPAVSADGRFVAFLSDATDLVAGDTNGSTDVFLRDRQLGTTQRVSVGAGGWEASFPSYAPSISADGRCVAFASDAWNLYAEDANGWRDVFVRDRGAASAFVPFCFGDGSLVPCPCGNSGVAGHGCENSLSTGGALLTATGEASLSADTVQFTCSGERPTSLSIVLQGSLPIAPLSYGDGLRCVGGVLKRLYTKNAVAGVVIAPQGGDLSVSARSATAGDPISLGATRNCQVYYRDPAPSFCPNPPGSTFNISNGIAVAWGG